jgi:hypothetical protein
MQQYLTFADVADAMRSPDVRPQEHLPYWNKKWKEGTTIGFSIYPRWFEVNIHDAKNMSWNEALSLLTSSSKTELNNSDPDEYGNCRWFGAAQVGKHHVRVWYNPRAF